jgi:hypothetical protein
MGILLVSLSAALVPTTSAGILYNLQSYVNVYYNSTEITNIPIQPRGTGRAIDLDIEYGITVSGGIFNILGSFLQGLHFGRTVTIKVEAVEYPEWATVTVSQWPTAYVKPESDRYPTSLTVKIDEDAPAYGKGDIKLRVTVPQVGLIEGVTKEIGIAFSAAYLPIVTHEFVEGNTKLIGPTDTAEFPIEIINMGNARTEVIFEITNVPDGWSAIGTDNIIVEEGEGSKTTIYLAVKPPKDFGYHDDTATISLKYTPYMAENPNFDGDPKTINVLVERRGFSVVGIEIVILPIIIIVVILLLLYQFVIKKRLRK